MAWFENDSQRGARSAMRYLVVVAVLGIVAFSLQADERAVEEPAAPRKVETLQAEQSQFRADLPREPLALPIGQECTVHLARNSQDVQQGPIEGRLLKLDDEWIVLEGGSGAEQGVPVAVKAPYVKKVFKNIGVKNEGMEFWIPRNSIVYLAVEAEE